MDSLNQVDNLIISNFQQQILSDQGFADHHHQESLLQFNFCTDQIPDPNNHPDLSSMNYESMAHFFPPAAAGEGLGTTNCANGLPESDRVVLNSSSLSGTHGLLTDNTVFLFTQDMENDDDTRGKGKAVEKREFEGSVSRPVSPGESGEGLPYAPQHWPNPGDIWVWRVGYRFSKAGIFKDRYLRIPRRLEKRQTRLALEFQSKPAVERYLRSNFPEADISAFFASFTWVIRVKPELIGKYVHCPRTRRAPVKKLEKNRGDRVSKRMHKAVKTLKEEEMSSHIAVDGEETFAASSSFHASQVSDDLNVSQANNLVSQIDCKEDTNNLLKKPQGDPSPEEFDKYLKSLDEILYSPPLSMHQYSSSSMEEAMSDSRFKLSSLLATETPDRFLSSENTVTELIALSYKLQNDPNLSMEELSMLKLIQSIPFVSKSFVEAKKISSKADEFFGGLNAKIASVASLKEDYNASKEEMESVQADDVSSLLDILDIDQEILKLEKLRQEKAERIKANSEKLIRLNSIQKTVIGSLPKIVNDIQMAKCEKTIWEHKKKKAAELEAEILARFAPLEGFSF